MDITAVALNDVISVYNRQEKLAQARKSAEGRLIKTAVAERITLSKDAMSLFSVELSKGTRPAPETVQNLPGGREFYSAAREYSRNKPIDDQPTGPARETEAASPVFRTQPESGRPESLPTEMRQTPASSAQFSAQYPQYSFPVPRELQAYISNIPKEKRVPPCVEDNRRAAGQ
ncbi:MAG: hypothetical protein HZA01_02430 [Nitrospinae bacterium]|nr:hypothetical protein [Nitrospinota bacterium]